VPIILGIGVFEVKKITITVPPEELISSMSQDDLQNFFSKIEKTNTCWYWIPGFRTDSPSHLLRFEHMAYGMRKKRTDPRHVLKMLILLNLEQNCCIKMACGIRDCVNPEHFSISNPRSKFLSNIDFTESCWIWTANRHGKGYGQITEANKSGDRSCIKAHRRAWKYFAGEIPEGLQVLHKCDNPPCVRPDHLFLRTNDDNIRDKVSKGRMGQAAKLTKEEVIEIDKLLNKGLSIKDIGDSYNVNVETIRDIKSRRSWAWVFGEESTTAKARKRRREKSRFRVEFN
tara:strand:+ start:3551 stop:4408 length:858 start_codon:yes stop_codon:yes gene_type:complete